MPKDKLMMKLKRPLPTNRTVQQIWNHYQVERALASKLKQSDREGRRTIYATMYEELFLKVPDHPRLTTRDSAEMTAAAIQSKMKVIRRFVNRETVFAEFAPGDCKFAMKLCRQVRFVYGIDISDQRGQTITAPVNFKLIVYNGYHLELEENSVDVVFSDQLIEHLHPEDTIHHFQLVQKILKKNGLYVFRTPHSFCGPHDISGYFSDEAEGFHLKEWTYQELAAVLSELKFSSWRGILSVKGVCMSLPAPFFVLIEKMLGTLPRNLKRLAARHLLPRVSIVVFR